jgi:ribosomal protein S27AE
MATHTDELITQLIQAFVADELRAYLGNLTFAALVVENNWLPAEDEPGTQDRLSTLRQHLATIGHVENDAFLLRLGLTAPGTQRGIIPPLMALDENRGGFSARRQREAERQILRLREAIAIGRRFISSLSRNSQQAITELTDFVQRRVAPSDTVWLRWFNEISPEGADQLAAQAIDCLDRRETVVNEIGFKILKNLACFRQPPLSEETCKELIEKETFWPASMYRDSGDSVAIELISRIEDSSEELLALNRLLLALAWTRSAAAHQAFRRWSENSPAWASKLHVRPEQYLHSAGWYLDEDGQRRDLISTSCFRLLLAERAAASNRIRCRTRVNTRCPRCSAPLALLFDFRQTIEDRLWGEFADAPRKVESCLNCSCHEPIFTSFRPDGTAEWLSTHEATEFPYSGDREPCLRQLSDSPCPPFACAEPFALNDASTLGGIPMWLQDAEYPRCVECGRLMSFLAQHDNSPLGEEGIYYAFFCGRCHVAAVTYQQT